MIGTIVLGIVLYIFIGFIAGCIYLKMEGMTLDKVDDSVVPIIIVWPLVLFICTAYLFFRGCKKVVFFIAEHIFKVPPTDPNIVHADDGGAAFMNTLPLSMQNRGGHNPLPTTPKPEGVIPPSQKAMVKEIPRTDLIDIED